MSEKPNLVFRTATRADLPAVLQLYAQPSIDDGITLPLAQAERIFERMQRYPDYTLHVAEREGAVVGSIALLIMDNLGHMGAPSAVVEDVVVDPACQRQGIGRAMLAYVLDIARSRGCYKLALSSNQKRVDAHAFYESLGFRRHGYSFVVEA
ncbi:MAG TPA: GNAT family N-acetyltransferase [Burkholderiaceae bacterium]|nr:GNAT family N-acetyltransferase [Burkholderiaceae bacterium]